VEDELEVSEEPVEEGMPEGYDQNVEAEEVVEADNEEIGTFKIDDNMPEELKSQLTKFNEKASKFNQMMSEDAATPNEFETTSYDEEGSDEFEEDEDISDGSDEFEEEDNVDVDNLF
jgi:hypothetical protein